MHTKLGMVFRGAVTAAFLVAIAGGAPQVNQEDETYTKRLLKMSESDQIVWLNNYIADGAPVSDSASLLAMSKPLVFLPILEQRIEEILQSPAPKGLFREPSVNPQKVVALAASMIEEAGSGQSLREASKLMKIDEHLFGNMVNATLWHVFVRANPFTVAYQGSEIGDPVVDQKTAEWVHQLLGLNDQTPQEHTRVLESWAEAIVEKYNGAPIAVQWTNDPIISRLSQAEQDSLRGELPRFITEAAQKQTKK